MSALEGWDIRVLLKALGNLFLGVGALSFLFGGRALHEFAGVNRFVAECEGLGAAIVLFIVGALLKKASESDSDS
jgi:hypothetical protein